MYPNQTNEISPDDVLIDIYHEAERLDTRRRIANVMMTSIGWSSVGGGACYWSASSLGAFGSGPHSLAAQMAYVLAVAFGVCFFIALLVSPPGACGVIWYGMRLKRLALKYGFDDLPPLPKPFVGERFGSWIITCCEEDEFAARCSRPTRVMFSLVGAGVFLVAQSLLIFFGSPSFFLQQPAGVTLGLFLLLLIVWSFKKERSGLMAWRMEATGAEPQIHLELSTLWGRKSFLTWTCRGASFLTLDKDMNLAVFSTGEDGYFIAGLGYKHLAPWRAKRLLAQIQSITDIPLYEEPGEKGSEPTWKWHH